MVKVNVLIVALLIVSGGCIPTKMEIQTLTNDVDKLMASVDDYQIKYAEEVDSVQDDIIVVNEAIKEKADEDVMEQLRAGIEASAPFNPYADEMNAILGLGIVIAGLFGKKKMDDANKANNEAENANRKYQAHKSGTELIKLAHPDIAAELYEKIGNARKANGVT